MSIWQIAVLVVIAGGLVACLLAVSKAIQELGKGIAAIGTELKRMNAKLESVEAVSKDSPERPAEQYDNELEALEAAISNFEKLKRIDLPSS